MDWVLFYAIAGIIVGIGAIYVANRAELFDDAFDFEEFMLNNVGRMMIFLGCAAAWPVAIVIGGFYVYWMWHEGEWAREKKF